jgi:hypothetical protein
MPVISFTSATTPPKLNGWSMPSSPSAKLSTRTVNEQCRLDHFHRHDQFLQANMLDFPEEAEVIDTLRSKATRTAALVVTAANRAGIGGAYLAAIHKLMTLHRVGLASLLFHSDLQKTVYVLLSFLNLVATDIGLTTRDVMIGSYFSLWHAKRERLLCPQQEFEQHAMGQPGVLDSVAPQPMLDEFVRFFPLVGMSYREEPSHIQWTLKRFEPKLHFQLIMSKTTSQTCQPSFLLAASSTSKECILAIRGTNELDDLVTDGLADVKEAPFGKNYRVHSGMLDAGKWLLADNHESGGDGAGVAHVFSTMWNSGYKTLVLCGHSLGGGVAILAALLLAEQFPDMKLKVYAYGTPSVVCEQLAKDLAISNQVVIKNLINRDDMIPRLTIRSARDFCEHLKATREQWGPLLNEDLASFTQRVQSAWAPQQRARSMSRTPEERVSSTTPPKPSKNEDDEEWMKRNTWDALAPSTSHKHRLEKSVANPLVVPGTIVHIFEHHGKPLAGLVNYKFMPLRRIVAFQHSPEDHKLDNMMLALRNVLFARGVSQNPPHWESLRDHENDAEVWTVNCGVCKYAVSWLNTSGSEASEIRATNHCYSCGKMVCSACSSAKMPLPQFGILTHVRVCDFCRYSV